MKKSRFSDSQIMEALNGAESGIKVPDLFRGWGSVPLCFSVGVSAEGGWRQKLYC